LARGEKQKEEGGVEQRLDRQRRNRAQRWQSNEGERGRGKRESFANFLTRLKEEVLQKREGGSPEHNRFGTPPSLDSKG